MYLDNYNKNTKIQIKNILYINLKNIKNILILYTIHIESLNKLLNSF